MAGANVVANGDRTIVGIDSDDVAYEKIALFEALLILSVYMAV